MQNKKTPKGILFVISAPSGAGKTSICKELLNKNQDLYKSISYTTRRARNGELDGFDYHFVNKDTFSKMASGGEFAEWAEVHGNCYGTSLAALSEASESGKDVLLDIDYQGAAQLRESGVDGVFIFVLPPNMDELRNRLNFRNTDDEDVIERRMVNAQREISESIHFDYLIVNDVLEKAVDSVCSIMTAEKCRTQRSLPVFTEEFGLK